MLKKDKKILESLANKYGVSTLKEEIDLGQYMSSAERKSIYRNNSRTRDEEMIYSEIKRLRRAMLNATSQEEEDRYSMKIDRLKRELDREEEENTLTEEELDAWWGNLGFEEMEVATGYSVDDFDPEDGYQEFIDVCDEWWSELSYEEKKGVYSEVMR